MNVYCQGFPTLVPTFSTHGWKLYDDFIFIVDGTQYIIPTGFETDLASTDWPVTLFVPRWGRYGVGSIVHDFCYRTQLFDRKKCDDVFREIMKLYNTRKWEEVAIYYSVRLLGFSSYNKYKLNGNKTKK